MYVGAQIHAGQARDVGPMLGRPLVFAGNRHDVLALAVLIWCRTGVVGGGPALNRHRACLLGDQMTNRNNSYYHFCYFLSVFSFISCNQFITT